MEPLKRRIHLNMYNSSFCGYFGEDMCSILGINHLKGWMT